MSELWLEGDMSPEDMGEMLTIIREVNKLSEGEMADKLKITEDTYKKCEQGRGAHVFNALFKACLKFKYKATIEIKA
jgi:DNA-binding XRE family transcriptional regulator